MRGRKYSCRKRNPLAPAEVLAINLSIEVSCELAQATSSFCVRAGVYELGCKARKRQSGLAGLFPCSSTTIS